MVKSEQRSECADANPKDGPNLSGSVGETTRREDLSPRTEHSGAREKDKKDG